MTRNGKIARLPKDIRDELNLRLQNGESARRILDWIHEFDETWEMLDKYFECDPINEQNISAWKAGGYRAWEANQEARSLVSEIVNRSDDLAETAEGANLDDCLGLLLMTEMIKLAKVLVQKEEDPAKRWKELCRVNQELSQLRKDKVRDTRTKVHAARWAQEHEKQQRKWTKEDREDKKRRHAAPYTLRREVKLVAALNQCGPLMAGRILEINNDLPLGRLEERKDGLWIWTNDEWEWSPDRPNAKRPEPAKNPPAPTPPKAKKKKRRTPVEAPSSKDQPDPTPENVAGEPSDKEPLAEQPSRAIEHTNASNGASQPAPVPSGSSHADSGGNQGESR